MIYCLVSLLTPFQAALNRKALEKSRHNNDFIAKCVQRIGFQNSVRGRKTLRPIFGFNATLFLLLFNDDASFFYFFVQVFIFFIQIYSW